MPEIKIKNENNEKKIYLVLANSPKHKRMSFHFDCFYVWFVIEVWLNG